MRVRAERVPRLTRRHHEQTAVQIRQIIHPAIARPVALRRTTRAACRHERSSYRRRVAGCGRTAAATPGRQRWRYAPPPPSPSRRVRAKPPGQVLHRLMQRRIQHGRARSVAPSRRRRVSRPQHPGQEIRPRPRCRRRQAGMRHQIRIEPLHPRVEDQRLGCVHRHRAVPPIQQGGGMTGQVVFARHCAQGGAAASGRRC